MIKQLIKFFKKIPISEFSLRLPNQKKVLGIVECPAEDKPKHAKTAVITSRVNTLLSLPMLLTMVIAQHLY